MSCIWWRKKGKNRFFKYNILIEDLNDKELKEIISELAEEYNLKGEIEIKLTKKSKIRLFEIKLVYIAEELKKRKI